MEFNQAFGIVLKKIRNEKLLSQQEVATRCGSSLSTISRIETASFGDSKIGTLLSLAEALEIDPCLLLRQAVDALAEANAASLGSTEETPA